MKIIDAIWYSPQTHSGLCVGIVLVDTGFGHKAYIGVGTGINEEADKALIAAQGARFNHGASVWAHVKQWAA